ncbi:MAG TPA: M48 family peptidase [Chromatiales bacterium]|nr:M48 family peptidase [Chromatiales bacterium]
MPLSNPIHRFVLALSLTVLAMGGCATSPTGRSQLMLVSESQAIAASKTAYVETLQPFAKKGKLDNDPALKRRVERITARLVAQAVRMRPDTRDWEWSVAVIDDPKTVNAWCMAGGKMAIYTGLIQQLHPTDDELAQVMAHEIAHALAKHQAEKMSVSMASKLGVMAAGIVGAAVTDRPGMVVGGAAAAALLAVELPNSRAAEAEADRIGIELAAKAGYDPRAAVTLWEKMGALSGSRPPQFLSTHPAPKNRKAALQALVPQMMRYYRAAKDPPSLPLHPPTLGG